MVGAGAAVGEDSALVEGPVVGVDHHCDGLLFDGAVQVAAVVEVLVALQLKLTIFMLALLFSSGHWVLLIGAHS